MNNLGLSESPPFVSIVIPNYNGERFIKRCLRSVLKTNYPDFQVTLVDGASRDGSIKLAKELFGSDEFKPMFGVDHKTRWGGLSYLLRRRAIMKVAEPRGICLDIGCGDGRYCRELLRRGGTYYVGLDIDRKSLKNAKATNSNPKVSFIVADARYQPIRSESIDFALCTEVLEHIENYILVIGELHKVIKKRGDLVVSVPCFTIGKLFICAILWLLRRDWDRLKQAPDHKREFCIIAPFEGLESIREFKIKFLAKGLAVLEQYSANVLHPFDMLFLGFAVLHPERHQKLAWLIIKVDELLAKILKDWGNYLILKITQTD